MQRLHIGGLPHVVNALIMTSVFSAGNGLLFAAARSLHGLAVDGKAPKIFSRCTRAGVPIFAVLLSLAFCLLAFLQVSSSSAQVLGWLVDLVTACQLLNYLSVAITYCHFYAALRKQGINRNALPYKGKFQPYTAYMAILGTTIMILVSGYYLFMDGGWSTRSFFLTYTMPGVFVLAIVFWKIAMRTTYVRLGTADLGFKGEKEEIDKYEEEYIPTRSSFLDRLF
jgi:amino acid transporter